MSDYHEDDPLLEDLERLRKIEAAADRMRDALHQIDDWAKAYPLKVFPEPDLKLIREMIGDRLFTALNAHTMRHVIEGVGKIAAAALAAEGTKSAAAAEGNEA